MTTYRRRTRFALPCLVALLTLGLAVGCAGDGVETEGASDRDAEILWDEWGIPHIRAGDAESLFFAHGWAQARNHPELLLRNVGKARARGAEYWGREHLDDDRWYRLTRLGGWAEDAYREADDEIRRYVDAFAEGISAYYDEHPEAVSGEMEAVLPLSGVDVMANAGAISLRFSSARRVRERWLRGRSDRGDSETSAGASTSPAPQAATTTSWSRERPSRDPERQVASNAWAVGPSKSADGHAMLLANPHLPWSGNLTWMEVHLEAPGVEVYGASLLGMPMVNIGFTPDLGWTHTVNTQDTEDLYELEIVGEGEDLGYRWEGGMRPFERRRVELRVRTSEGTETEELELLRSVHGPVIARTEEAALALRRVDDIHGGGGDALRQWWEMARASGLEEFTTAISGQAIVGQNVVYADRHGDIAYFYGGATPRRPKGDVAFWRGVLPGDREELLWTEIHSFEEMPRVVNPASGWVQNANDPPWRSTWPPELEPSAYPPYLAPSILPFRPQRSIRMLRESDGIDLETVIELKHSTRMELADRIVPELLAAVEEHGGDAARRAAEVLESWDRTADADSRGAVLFAAWYEEARDLPGNGPFAERWSPEASLSTPDGLADPARAAVALASAARRVEEAYGSVEATWGEVNRLRRDHLDLAGNGGPGSLGIFRVTGFRNAGDGRRVAMGGDSFVVAVEFGDPLRAFALIGYGNASRTGSPHRTDQLELYASKELRAVHFAPDEVEAGTMERTAF